MKIRALLILSLALVAACATEEPTPFSSTLSKTANSVAFLHPGKALSPNAALYSGNAPAIIRYIEPGHAAQAAGIQIGDTLLRLNGKKLFSAGEFERQLKFAPRNSSLTLQRGNDFKMIPVVLENENPRLGAGFEPEAKALRRQSSPYIAYMHIKDMTVFVQSSLNDVKKELHVNFIVKSDKDLPATNMNFLISEKGQPTPVGRGFDQIDALSETPQLIQKVFKKEGTLKGPLEVSLNIDKRHFQFEFK